jgi:hypothetical protein
VKIVSLTERYEECTLQKPVDQAKLVVHVNGVATNKLCPPTTKSVLKGAHAHRNQPTSFSWIGVQRSLGGCLTFKRFRMLMIEFSIVSLHPLLLITVHFLIICGELDFRIPYSEEQWRGVRVLC